MNSPEIFHRTFKLSDTDSQHSILDGKAGQLGGAEPSNPFQSRACLSLPRSLEGPEQCSVYHSSTIGETDIPDRHDDIGMQLITPQSFQDLAVLLLSL